MDGNNDDINKLWKQLNSKDFTFDETNDDTSKRVLTDYKLFLKNTIHHEEYEGLKNEIVYEKIKKEELYERMIINRYDKPIKGILYKCMRKELIILRNKMNNIMLISYDELEHMI